MQKNLSECGFEELIGFVMARYYEFSELNHLGIFGPSWSVDGVYYYWVGETLTHNVYLGAKGGDLYRGWTKKGDRSKTAQVVRCNDWPDLAESPTTNGGTTG